MTSLVMDVYRAYRPDESPWKDWAVAINSGEVITRWGKSGGPLQGGVPVKRQGKPAQTKRDSLVKEKEAEGYRYQGTYPVTDDGEIQWDSQKSPDMTGSLSFKTEDYLLYAELEGVSPNWVQRVCGVFEPCALFTVSHDALGVTVQSGNGLPVELRQRQAGGKINFPVRRGSGPEGMLAALAIAKTLGARLVDGKDQTVDPSKPMQTIKSYFDAVPQAIEDAASELGLVLRIALRVDANIRGVSF